MREGEREGPEVVVRNGGVGVRIKKSLYLVLSPNSVCRGRLFDKINHTGDSSIPACNFNPHCQHTALLGFGS